MMLRHYAYLPLGYFFWLVLNPPAFSLPITSANDNLQTIVTPDGQQFNITGGQSSSDGANLFHSFQEFGLNSQQIANFLSNSNVQNILGRVTGGNASIIDGLIQVSGSNANLYLMNPAGIIFGSNARLNVPGDFFATTATGIGFDNNQWFNALGEVETQSLIGTPSQFAFDLTQNAPIVNGGNLSVETGNNVTLLAGNVINTGTITAPQGNILISAVPNSSLVKISQPGHLLSLEIETPRDIQGELLPITLLDLPTLLTGSNVETGLTTTPEGTVQFNNTQQVIPTDLGTTLVSGQLDVSGTTGGTVTLLGEKVGVLGANINASGLTSGGQVLMGGDYQGEGTIPNAKRTFVDSTSVITADAILEGDGGRVILWADELTRFYGNISATGGEIAGDGGFVEVSGKESLVFAGDVDVSAGNGELGTLLLDPANINIVAGLSGTGANDSELNDNAIFGNDSPGTTFTISTGKIASLSGNIILEATNNITMASGVSLTVSCCAAMSLTFKADSNQDGNGSFSMDTSQSLTADGIALSISGATITAGHLKATGDLIISSTRNTEGNIQFTSIYQDTSAPQAGVVIDASGTVRGTGQVPGYNHTIIADKVTITHDGGANNTAFSLNDSSVNGLVSGILDFTTGTQSLTSGSFSVKSNGGSDFPSPNVTITSVNSPPALQPIEQQQISSSGTLTLTYSQLLAKTSDVNGDNLTLTLSDFSNQGIFKLNGNQVTANSVNLSQGDVLEFTPFADSSQSYQLFKFSASDGVSVSPSQPVNVGSFTLNNQLSNEFNNKSDFNDFNNFNHLLPQNHSHHQGIGERPGERGRGRMGRFTPVRQGVGRNNLDVGVERIDNQFTGHYQKVLPEGVAQSVAPVTLSQTQDILTETRAMANIEPAIAYMSFLPAMAQETGNEGVLVASGSLSNLTAQGLEIEGTDELGGSPNDTLQLVLVTADGTPILRSVPEATRGKVMALAQKYRQAITNPNRPSAFLQPAMQLYEWLIRPLQEDLNRHKINNIAFVMDAGLRSLPLAALYDAEKQQFLIEQYSTGLMPSLALTNTEYRDLREVKILGMGASTFDGQSPLPAVPLELELITQQLWKGGEFYLNESFTVEKLNSVRSQNPYSIVHLGTHGEFNPGRPENSAIFLGNGQKLALNELRSLNLHNPPVDLLVLSACRTALGDLEAELGFAGLAVQAGVKTALGSLWYVSDEGTMTLMTTFYEQLQTHSTKAEALRQAQLAMLQGKARFEGDQVVTPDNIFPVTVPELQALGERDVRHPYYWSGFTLIGSPW